MTLPVATHWYDTKRLGDRLWLITEPHVHPIFSANMHLVLGQDADLLIDSGMGIAPLRPVVDGLRPDPDKPVICLSTHTHVDHIGAAHEFETRLVHPIEAEELAKPSPYSLRSADLSAALQEMFVEAGYDTLWEYLVDALPSSDYDLDAYAIAPAPATGFVEDGDVVDLGDWRAEVLHLPGHSPGQLGLWHAESGTLFGGDAIYDGPLIYDGTGMSIAEYANSLKRLREMPIHTVHGGHDPAFDGVWLQAIIKDYLERWGMA